MFTALWPVLLVTLAPCVIARKGRGGDGDDSDTSLALNLNSVNTATFSIFIILAVFTVLQLLKAISVLRRECSHLISCFSLLLTILLLLVKYLMATMDVTNRSGDVEDLSTSGPVFAAILQLSGGLADVFMGVTLLSLIDQRYRAFARSHGLRSTTTNRKRALDSALLLLMTASIVISQTIFASASSPRNRAVTLIVMNFYHVYITFYILVTLDIVYSAFILWNRLAATSPVDNCIRVILKFVSPFLVIHVLFDLAVDIATSLPEGTTTSIDSDALLLTTALVEGISYFCALYYLLSSQHANTLPLQHDMHMTS